MTSYLPAEVLECIVSYVSRDDLWTLYRVSKDFNRSTTPALYRTIVIRAKSDAGKKPCIHLLFRTLVENASLASLVKNFILLGDRLKKSPSWTTDTLSRHFAQAKEDCGITTSGWDSQWACGDVDVVIPLLLSRLPNLQRLELGINFLDSVDFHPLFFVFHGHPSSSRANKLRFLSHRLECITFASDLDTEGKKLRQNCWDKAQYHRRSPDAVFAEKFISPTVITDILGLPGLRTIDILLPESMRTWAWADDVASNTTLTTLILRSTVCGEDTLEEFLKRAPQLRNLTYERFYDPGEIPNRLPQPGKLLEALNHVKDTLEVLSIKLERYRYPLFDGNHTGGEDQYPGPYDAIGSLREFRKLRLLEIPVEIFGAEQDGDDYVQFSTLLPGALEQLTLRNDFVYFIAFYPWPPNVLTQRLSSWLKNYYSDEHTHLLSALHLNIHFDGYWWSDRTLRETIHQLAPLCQAVDLKLTSR